MRQIPAVTAIVILSCTRLLAADESEGEQAKAVVAPKAGRIAGTRCARIPGTGNGAEHYQSGV